MTHSFPTRRCSDLGRPAACRHAASMARRRRGPPVSGHPASGPGHLPDRASRGDARAKQRSEEHTSELQSLMRISYAVFCLKTKKNILSITPLIIFDYHYLFSVIILLLLPLL